MSDIGNSSFSTSTDVKGLLSLGCIVLQPWKIESSSKNPDNSWSYLVRWRDVWLHENICSKFSNLIDEYWLEQNNKGGEFVAPGKTVGGEEDFHAEVREDQIEVEGENESESIQDNLVEEHEPSTQDTIQDESDIVPPSKQECNQVKKDSIDDTNQESTNDSSIAELNIEEGTINILSVSEDQSMKTYPAETLKPPSTKSTYINKGKASGKDTTKEPLNILSRRDASIALQRGMPQLINNVVNRHSMNSSTLKDSEKKTHGSTYKKSGPRKCEYCDKILSSQNALREHRIVVHLKNGRFPCTFEGCDKRYTQRRALRIHMVSHTNERNFVCEKCGSTHKRPRELKLHMIDMHSETQTYRCDVCFKCFKEKAQLKHHCLNEHKDTVTVCIVCKQHLSTPYSIYIHCLKHADVREFECDICKGEYKTAKALADHKKIHDPERKPFRNCPKCGKAIYSRSHFYEHVNSHDSKTNEVIKFSCDICGSKFQHSSSLKRHALRHRPGGDLEHPKVNPYLTMDESLLPSLCCRICRRNYTSKSGYYDHIRKCRDGVDTSVNCALCEKKYSKRSALNRHLRVHHPDMLAQMYEGSLTEIANGDAVNLEVEPTTVEVLNVGEANEIEEQSGVQQLQFQVALAPDSVDVIETEVETLDNETI